MSLDPAEQRRRDDLRIAVRALLRAPLLRRADDPEAYELVRRTLEPVERWFADTAGWAVEHDRPSSVVRLKKVAAWFDGTRPAQPEFTRRHYALLCVLLAELDRVGRQITLQRLAEHLREATAAEPEVATFDATLYDERRAFVQVVRWLIDTTGVLARRDGDEEGFLRSSTNANNDALYDVDDRTLALLLASPRSPSSVSAPEQLSQSFYADTDEGRRKRLGQLVFRRLLDDPVVYFDDLSPEAREWLTYSLRRVIERLHEAGLVLERRYEGVAAIDPDGELCQPRFPVANSTASHAALLLAEWLTRARTARMAEIEERIAEWRSGPQGARWRSQTPHEIARSALDVLLTFQLATVDGDRVHARPAIARFRAAPGPQAEGP